MKPVGKILFLIALTTAKITVAQSLLAYGNVGYDYHNGGHYNVFSISPGIGYQVSQHFTVGVSGSYDYMHVPSNSFDPMDQKTTFWAGGLWGRYTHSLGKRFFLYGQLSADYMAEKDKFGGWLTFAQDFNPVTGLTAPPQYYIFKHSSSGLRFSFIPTVGFNVWKGLALNISMGGVDYTNVTHKNWGTYLTDKNAQSQFLITAGQQVIVGISKSFGNHKQKKPAQGKEIGFINKAD